MFVACAAVLAAYAAVARVRPGDLWRRVRVVLPLVLLAGVLLPFVRTGGEALALGPLTVHEAGLAIFAALAAKATIGTLSAALLGATTTFPAVLRGLEAMRVPRLLVLIAAFMYRYLFVIAGEAGRMRAALLARGYRPRHALQAGPMGRVATAMFLRTYGRGERVYLAMLARGYRGAMPQLVPLSFGRADVAFVALVLIALVPLRRDRRDAVSCAIHARGLTYRYPNGRQALRGVDLHVEHGERVALLGPNGAGKTTFMLHLNGLLTGAGGLEVAGLEVGRDTLHELRARVGLVFQDPDDQLFMPTVAEDVAFGPLNLGLDRQRRGARAWPRRWARCAWRTSPSARRYQLSMGERRRVAIATVLAMHPALLVLDEPSANLDPRARRELLDVLARDRPDDARDDPRPPARRRAVRARRDPRRRPRRRRRPLRRASSPTTSCSPRTTSSCRPASTSAASGGGRARTTRRRRCQASSATSRSGPPAVAGAPRAAQRAWPRRAACRLA